MLRRHVQAYHTCNGRPIGKALRLLPRHGNENNRAHTSALQTMPPVRHICGSVDARQGQSYNTRMKSPFPGMDPYLENPALWPDIQNRFIAALAGTITPMVAPRSYVVLERRAYLSHAEDVVFAGRPDLSLIEEASAAAYTAESAGSAAVVVEVEVPTYDDTDGAGDDYLAIRDVRSGRLITLIEQLSPANKIHNEGRRQ